MKVSYKGATTTLVLFDSIVSKLIGDSAKTIRDKQIMNEDLDAIPEELEFFLNKTYIFIFKVDEYFNIVRRSKSFTVSGLTDDQNMIQKFEEIVNGLEGTIK